MGHRFVASNSTLRSLLAYAYGTKEHPLVPVYQIAGGPTWIDADRFDVEGRWPDEAAIVQDVQLRQMVQTLLEDRFQLKAHWQTREMPMYKLTVAKGGLKMSLSENQTKPNPVAGTFNNEARATFQPFGAPGGLKITLRSASIGTILGFLQNRADRPVVDKTGLTDLYDAQLELDGDRWQALSLIQEQLGLKLESSKGNVEVLVIDSVSRPTEN